MNVHLVSETPVWCSKKLQWLSRFVSEHCSCVC